MDILPWRRPPVVIPVRRSAISRPKDVDIPVLSLTASAVKVTGQKESDFRRLIQPWQARALSYYDLIGECWFAAQFYARSLSQVRVFVAKRSEDGEFNEVDVNSEDPNDQKALEFLARVKDPGGGRAQLQASYGRLMFITGEGYLLVTEEDGQERWEFVSSDELRLDGSGTYTRFSSPNLTAEMLKAIPDDAFVPIDSEDENRKMAGVYRFWRRHPRYSALADSPMRATLDVLEELLLLTLAVRARAKSRLSGPGLLLIPEEISPAPPTTEGDEDPMVDPFLAELTEAMVAPISDEGTASAVVPLIVRGQSEYLAEIRRVPMQDPLETYPETGLRNEAIKRFAMGADFPPEILLGLTEANHWTGWQIDEQTAKSHIFPVCQQFVDDLTGGYFQPALKEDGVDNWQDYMLGYDAAAVVNKPDRAKDAKDLHKVLVISDATLRDSGGYTDTDAPGEEELKRRIGLELKDLPTALGDVPDEQEQPEVGTEEDQSLEIGVADETAPTSAAEVNPEQPTDGVAAMAAAACQMTVLRAREMAGAKARKPLHDRHNGSFADIANVSLCAAAGPDLVREAVGKTEAELVAGSTTLLQTVLGQWGVDEPTAELIASGMKRHAVRTLYAVDQVALKIPAGVQTMLERL